MALFLFVTSFAEDKAEPGNKILIFFSGWSCKECFHHIDSALEARSISGYEYVICDQDSRLLYNDYCALVKTYSGNKSALVTIDSMVTPEKHSRKRPPCHLYERYKVDITPSVLIIKNGDTTYIAYEKLFGDELNHELLDSIISAYKK